MKWSTDDEPSTPSAQRGGVDRVQHLPSCVAVTGTDTTEGVHLKKIDIIEPEKDTTTTPEAAPLQPAGVAAGADEPQDEREDMPAAANDTRVRITAADGEAGGAQAAPAARAAA